MIVLLGGIDYLTGTEFSFSIFYLLPVSMVAWFAGKRAGVLISVVSVVAWLIADLAAGHIYSHPAILPWNTLVRLGFFLIMTYILTILQTVQHKREELIQFVVHDLRSPLSIIILGLGVLQRNDDEMNETQRSLIKNAMASSQWLLTLINSLLDLSRLESRQMPLQIDQVTVKELIQLSLNQVTLWAERNQVSLVVQLEVDAQTTIYADRDVSMRVLVNLLSNAIRFGPPETVVTVRVAPVEANMLAFSVIDQGPGIPKKWAHKVFDKFVQVEARKAGAAVGSGLGLTFCRLAVEVQGGQIWLESDTGQGTTVTFTLPIHVSQSINIQTASLPDMA